MKSAIQLAFRPEDIEARRTNRTVIHHLSHGSMKVAWVFFPSGLQLLAPLKALPIIDINLALRHGARHEYELYGVAHALEHMVCKDVLSSHIHPLYEPLVPYGIKNNAWTNYEATCYWLQTQKRPWREALDALLKIVFASETLDQIRWERERPAILQEIRGREERRRIFDAIYAEQYRGNTRRQCPVLGREEDVLRIQANDLHEAYERGYHPQNALLIVQGHNDIHELIRFIEDHEQISLAAERSNTRIRLAVEMPPEPREQVIIRFPGTKSIESLRLTSSPYITEAEEKELWRCGWILTELYNMNGGLITQEFRRRHGMIYGASVQESTVQPNKNAFIFSGKMGSERMDEASRVWKQLWVDVCSELPTPHGTYSDMLRAFYGKFGLDVANRKLRRFRDVDSFLVSLWLRQDRSEPTAPMHDLSKKVVASYIHDAPRFTHLTWSEIRVVPR